MKSYVTIAAAAAMLLTVETASAQTVSHWLDRQAHGVSRHLTPRHHKPDAVTGRYFEHVYVEDMPGGGFRLTSYARDGHKVVKFYSSDAYARSNGRPWGF
jgi:predicted thioesterase